MGYADINWEPTNNGDRNRVKNRFGWDTLGVDTPETGRDRGQMVLKLAIARVGKDAIGVRYSYHILNSAFSGSDMANNSLFFFSRRAKEI